MAKRKLYSLISNKMLCGVVSMFFKSLKFRNTSKTIKNM